jgi:integrase/recombinase XerC
LAGSTLKEEEMRHPSSVWTDPDFAGEPLDKLVAEYIRHLEGRSNPVSPATIDKYRKSLLSLMRSMTRQQVPLTLESLTPAVVNVWVSEQRKMGHSEWGISTRLGTIKIFSSKYLLKHLELTTRDLLAKVPRFTPPEKPAQVLTEEEIALVLETYALPTFEDIRNKALVACYIATGLRLREVVELPYNALDRATGEVKFIRAKGNKERCAWLSQGAMKHVRAYLRIRPKTADDHRLWVQDDGTPLSVSGTQSVMYRLKQRSGIARLHWHLFRHGFAQTALRKGADIGTVQEMLGHTSNAMTRRYAGHVRQIEAARRMPKYAPI